MQVSNQAQLCLYVPLSSDNGAQSVPTYSTAFSVNGVLARKLPGPFCPCAGAGSHLTRLSVPRYETY
jgi:hypothetical protein